jgi:RNA polymerase sigma factor (sigma-70 family)
MSIDFADVYDEQLDGVYAFLAYRLGSREDAEDLAQLTFERAWRSWSSFDPSRASVRTWLLAIARNLLIDHVRSPRHRQDLALEDLPPGPGSLPFAADLGLSPELESALGCLGERERELIALRFGGDLSGPEIAEITGLSLANVQQILSRSLRRMRSSWRESGREGPDTDDTQER